MRSTGRSDRFAPGVTTRVLVVEDDGEMAALMREALERADCRVTLATCGTDAIEAIERGPFDVAIVDKELPSINGLDLISFLTHRSPDMSVMLMTAFGGALVAHAAHARGATRYLEKPVKLAELIDAVRAAPRSAPADRAPRRPPHPVAGATGARPFEGERANLWAIVLAGGQGRRLLPLTRLIYGEARPKQYAALAGARSMLGQTLARIHLAISPERTVVASLRSHARYLKSEPLAPGATVLLQPADRGTGAGVLVPVHWIHRRDPDATVAVFPSDHVVDPETAFMDRVGEAARFVHRHPEQIVLLGAPPTDPETEYGWIETGEIVGWARGGPVRSVRRFIEKPPGATARDCYGRGDLWNTLVFVAKASLLVDIGRQFLWPVHDALARVAFDRDHGDGGLRKAYTQMPTTNFSTAVLENCAPVLRVSELTGVTWRDLGSPKRALQSFTSTGVGPAGPERPGLGATCGRLG
jgi:mannose-1-phosphate guanylyltransferase/ActR/RegA family two-component response regulator